MSTAECACAPSAGAVNDSLPTESAGERSRNRWKLWLHVRSGRAGEAISARSGSERGQEHRASTPRRLQC